MAVAGVHCRAEGKELLQALKGSTIVFYTYVCVFSTVVKKMTRKKEAPEDFEL